MMEIEFKRKEKKYRIPLMVVLLTASCFLTYYFHALLRITIVFTHFFYIPVILACLWWKIRGLLVAIFLAVLLIFSFIFVRQEMGTVDDYLRASMFIIIASVVAALAKKIARTEEKTKFVYAELNQIFNEAAEGIWMVDKHFNILRINDRLCTLSGTRQDEAAGRKCYEVFHISLCHTPNCPLIRIRDGDKEHIECEVGGERNDGIRIACIMTATPFRGPDRKLIGIIENFRDISEQKKAEKALIQSEKLRALGEMAGGVAHDFNNLLAIILGNAQLLERGLERYKKEEITKRLGIIARTASQGGETVRRLQHFTGREISTDEFTRIDLNEIVRSALRSTSPRWKDEAEAKGITITIKEELGKLPPLLGNESDLMEVLTNLIFNAVEAMPDGGRITIKTQAKENEVHLYFTDTGKGIPDKIKINVFDPFFTTKGPKASGLGLSTSYGVIKRHEGDMKVESSKRKGTTFTITIPIPSEIPSEKERLKDSEKVSPQRILVIDDEEGVRDVLARILGEEGHRVSLAETGKKGLDKFKQGDFDLVLTDLGMPDMSGWELAKRIKEVGPSLPVGLITGWAVPLTKEKMKEKGVDFILSKPFDCTKVVREVNTYLKFKDQ